MSINSKKTVKEFLKTYSLKEVNESTLINVLEKQGYTVVFFNSIYNDSDVSNIIQALNLKDYILSNRGFTYANDKYRLVFINEDLSEEERIVLLAHEEGHIYCNHTTTNMIIGNDVLQEYEDIDYYYYSDFDSEEDAIKSAIESHEYTLGEDESSIDTASDEINSIEAGNNEEIINIKVLARKVYDNYVNTHYYMNYYDYSLSSYEDASSDFLDSINNLKKAVD